MKAFWIEFVCLFLVALGAFGLAWSGWYDVSAINRPSGIEVTVLHGIMRQSVRAHAGDIRLPADLADRASKGADDFDEMCAQHHGAPSKEPGEIGKGLNPQPPSLDEAAHRWTAPELFQIVKNGVRMTGMPAFGPTHDDDRHLVDRRFRAAVARDDTRGLPPKDLFTVRTNKASRRSFNA